jgi:homoserine O-succinyltransferase/O-acetyltransferase
MPVTVTTAQAATRQEHGSLRVEKSAKGTHRTPKRIVIGLLNNMSVGALDATERGFVALLESASDGVLIELRRFALPEVLKDEPSSIYRDRHYESSESLDEARVDALIVTGREPLTADLREERYWNSFVRVLEWAKKETISTVWSCLAAHAAVLHMDGIQRVRSERKHSGIFTCTRISDHAITAGVPHELRVPHSRWNGLREADLVRSGYELITRTESGEVDCFLKQGKSLFVFFQGHPEYHPETLLLEYRRDVGRFLRGEAASYPSIPQGFFDPSATGALLAIQRRAKEQKPEETLAQIASIFASADKQNGWHSAASRLYRNWLQLIDARKTSRPEGRHKRVASATERGEKVLQSMQL